MISLVNTSKWYGQVIGMNDVSCEILPGITALLGPNGAGKSTMLKLITGQLKPTTGTISVLDRRPFANPDVFRYLGYCPEMENCYDEMTGTEFVTFMGAMAGIGKAQLKSKVSESIEKVGMTLNAGRKIGGYSKGMRQRIKIAQGIIHDPKILILDEPLNGLDPVGRKDVTTLLHSMAERGVCVIVSSHILYEVEQMTSQILLMNRGRMLANGQIYEIREMIDKHPHHIQIATTEPRRLAKCLLDMPSILSVELDSKKEESLVVQTRTPAQFYNEFPEIVIQNEFVVHSFGSPDNNLESVFRYLVGG
ncbi:MAG: ABC transporter ATP-binding protein [Chthonomonadales bacterium]